MTRGMTTVPNPYDPRSNNETLAGEDDALLRQPSDEGPFDPDTTEVAEPHGDDEPTAR